MGPTGLVAEELHSLEAVAHSLAVDSLAEAHTLEEEAHSLEEASSKAAEHEDHWGHSLEEARNLEEDSLEEVPWDAPKGQSRAAGRVEGRHSLLCRAIWNVCHVTEIVFCLPFLFPEILIAASFATLLT